MLQVQLHHGAPVADWLTLRELRGHDEAVLESGDPWAATLLIGRLATPTDPGGASFDPWSLSVSDRDRAAASLYVQLYGPRVDTSVRCAACDAQMDIDFELVGVVRTPDFESLELNVSDDQQGRRWVHESLGRIRVPTVRDQLELSRWPVAERAQELVRRCAPDLTPGDSSKAELEDVLERIAPTCDVDLDTTCPECSHEQLVRFDVHSYLGASLLHERRYLLHELHRLACAYGWSRGEILELRRDERRELVRMVEREGRGLRR